MNSLSLYEYLDSIPVEKVCEFLDSLRTLLKKTYPTRLDTIKTQKELSQESEKVLKLIIFQNIGEVRSRIRLRVSESEVFL